MPKKQPAKKQQQKWIADFMEKHPDIDSQIRMISRY